NRPRRDHGRRVVGPPFPIAALQLNRRAPARTLLQSSASNPQGAAGSIRAGHGPSTCRTKANPIGRPASGLAEYRRGQSRCTQLCGNQLAFRFAMALMRTGCGIRYATGRTEYAKPQSDRLFLHQGCETVPQSCASQLTMRLSTSACWLGYQGTLCGMSGICTYLACTLPSTAL